MAERTGCPILFSLWSYVTEISLNTYIAWIWDIRWFVGPRLISILGGNNNVPHVASVAATSSYSLKVEHIDFSGPFANGLTTRYKIDDDHSLFRNGGRGIFVWCVASLAVNRKVGLASNASFPAWGFILNPHSDPVSQPYTAASPNRMCKHEVNQHYVPCMKENLLRAIGTTEFAGGPSHVLVTLFGPITCHGPIILVCRM